MIPPSALSDFRASLQGQSLVPGESGYDEARKIFNASIDKRPATIVCCAGVEDVIAAVKFARKHNVPVSIRGAGHNVAGTSLCDSGLVIDLSTMKRIEVDPTAQVARVQGGVTWAELAQELQRFDLAATGGYVGTTGVSGLTLGGGLGWMVRKHGLALDNLLSADIVTAEGELVTASANQNTDLFWGIRGGGGNFGVVTSFVFKVHAAGTVLAGLVLHPLSKAREPMRFWREFEATAPEEVTNGVVIFTAPAELPVPESLRSEPILSIGGVYVGALEAGEQALRSLREFGPPIADLFRPMPYSEAQTMADFLWPRGTFNYWKSGFLKALGDGAIDTILDFCARVPSARSVIVIEHNGDGAMSRIAADETAFSHRNCPYNLLVTSIWTDVAEAENNIGWTRDFMEAMKPFMADAVYVNYLGDEGDERVRAAYGNNYERLRALKDKYDPTNFFRSNQNIKPSRAQLGAIA